MTNDTERHLINRLFNESSTRKKPKTPLEVLEIKQKIIASTNFNSITIALQCVYLNTLSYFLK